MNNNKEHQDKDFLDVLGERLFDVIDQALPSMGWTMNSAGRWVSKVHIDGESSSDEASTVYETNPLWIQDFARGAKSVIWAVVDIEHKAETYTEAVAYLCRLAGVDAPQLTDEQRAKVLSTRRLNEAQKAYHTALMTDPSKEAQAVRDYLIRRGWSNRDVEHSGLGFVTETTRALLFAEEEAAKIAADKTHAMHYVGNYYTLAIPVWAGGNVCTFKFRNVFTADKKKRYRGLEGVNRPILGCIPLRGQTDTVIVVEGEMDALHDLSFWRQLGQDTKKSDHIPVVCTGMGAVTPKMAEDAVKRGVTYFILALDQDERKEAHTSASARNIHAAGGVALVMDYPQGVNGKKGPKDLDEMYCDLVDAEDGKKRPRYSVYDAQRMAATAIPYAAWLAQRLIIAPAQEGKDIEGLDSFKVRRDIGRAIRETPDEERPLVIGYINGLVSEGLDAQGLARETAAETANKARVAAYRRAADLLAKGDRIGAQKVLKRLETLDNGDGQANLQALFEAEQSQEYIYNLCPEVERIPLNFDLYANDRKYQAFVQTSAVTVFAGKSGHGKTTAELNVTISALDSLGDGQCVLLFSCEKDLRYIFDRLASVYAGRKEGVSLDLAQTVLSSHLQARRLRLYQLDDLGDIADVLAKEAATATIKAVVIDYIQILRLKDFRGNKKERMEQVCLDLRTLSLKYHTAVVVGAQLNRETPNPVDFSADNIGDAVDIDQLASETYLLWNSAEKPLKGNSASVEDAVNAVNAEFGKRRLNMKLDVPGSMYVQVAKTKRGDILPKYAEAALVMDAGGAFLPMQRAEAQTFVPVTSRKKNTAKTNDKFKSDNTLI